MLSFRIFVISAFLAAPIFGTVSMAFAEEQNSQEASSIQAPIATDEPASLSAEEADVQPLDNWTEISSPNSAPPEEHSEQEAVGASQVPVSTLSSPAQTGIYPVLGATRAILKKKQKARLKKVENKLRIIISQEQEEINKKAKVDPRGESEVRVCSVNFNSFGTKQENARLLKRIPAAELVKKERSILKAIAGANCDIVAVQGIIGRSPSFAIEALTGFVKKLSKQTQKAPWKFEVADSKEQEGFQAFLIKDSEGGPVQGFQIETIPNLIMKVPGWPLRTTAKLKKELVPRDFLKLTVEIKSKDIVNSDPLQLESKVSTKESKKLVVINGILADGVAPFVEAPRLLKLKIADVAVRLFEAEQKRITVEDQPIVLATIERVESIFGGVQQILTGRVKIDDFDEAGICKIISADSPEPKDEGIQEAEEEVAEGEEKVEIKKVEKPKVRKKVDFTLDTAIECGNPLNRAQDRFDILATVPFEQKVPQKVEGDKKSKRISKRDLELQTSGIFVVSADLKYSARKSSNLLDSAAGRVHIYNGLPGAYLVWVDLNW